MFKQLIALAVLGTLGCCPVFADDCAEGYLFADGNEVARLPEMTAVGSFGTLITRAAEGWILQNGSLEVKTKAHSVSIQTTDGTSTVPAYSNASFEQDGGAYTLEPPPANASAGPHKAHISKQSVGSGSNSRPVHVILKNNCSFSMLSPLRMRFQNGVALIDASSGIVVDTVEGTVQAPPKSVFVLSSSFGGVRLFCTNGEQPIKFILPDHQVAISPSEELLVCSHRPMQFEVTPNDGIGRKSIKMFDLGGSLTAVTSQFSIPTMLRSSDYFQQWTKTSGHRSQLSEELLKTAAAVSFARKAKQSFYVAPRSNVF